MDPTYKGLSVPTPTTRNTKRSILPIALLILGVLAFVVVAIIIFSNLSQQPNLERQRLLYRVDALAKFIEDGKRNIRSDAMNKINTDASIVLNSDISAIKKLISPMKSSDTTQALRIEENDAEAAARLKNATVNNQHDPTYKAILLDKLKSTYDLANTVQKKSGKETSAALENLKTHLQTFYDQLKDLSL